MSLTDNTTALREVLELAQSGGGGGSGGAGGSKITTGTFTVTNNGMLEPGTSEYILTATNLNSSTKIVIIVLLSDAPQVVFYRNSVDEEFVINTGDGSSSENLYYSYMYESTIGENELKLCGAVGGNSAEFVAL